MTKTELQAHADHVGGLFQAARAIAAALLSGRASKARKGAVRLVTADTDKPSGGYALLLVHLPGNTSPNEDYGTLDALHRAYYRALVSGSKDGDVRDAESLLSGAIRARDSALFAKARAE